MPPTALNKLVALQKLRLAEIEGIRSRLADRPLASIDADGIQRRLNALDKILDVVRRTHEEIALRPEAKSDPYIMENEIRNIEGAYELTMFALTGLSRQLQQAEAPTPTREASNPAVTSEDLGYTELPKMSLPKFSGREEDWENFFDSFTSMVHDVPGINDVTKLRYLKSCLEGEAAVWIRNVSTRNSNYASTWEALQTRYHNPRLFVFKKVLTLMNLPCLKRESTAELQALLDRVQGIVSSLRNAGWAVDYWDTILFITLSSQLDPDTANAWNAEVVSRERIRPGAEFRVIGGNTREKRTAPPPKSGPPCKVFHAKSEGAPTTVVKDPAPCRFCSGLHPLWKCDRFKARSVPQRIQVVRNLRACYNCFGGHPLRSCLSTVRCSVCNGTHHTMIHTSRGSETRSRASEPPKEKQESEEVGSPQVSLHAATSPGTVKKILLATARVWVAGPKGKGTWARALLDQGSEASFIAETITQLLGLPKRRICVPLSGLGAEDVGTARSIVRAKLRSAVDVSFQVEVDALVLPKLTSLLPSVSFDFSSVGEFFTDLVLADPEFVFSRRIDLILGADVYGQLLRPGLRKSSSSRLVAQDTALGWIISGPVDGVAARRAEKTATDSPSLVLHCSLQDETNQMLQRFWELEDVSAAPRRLKPEDESCEKIFQETLRRDRRGRYVVKLPLKAELPLVATEMKRMALNSLSALHRRFARDSRLAQAYREFMKSYEELGHMSRVPRSETLCQEAWYLPHHAVVQQNNSRWKLRVVFDASRRTRDGHSLNSFLLTGPALQGDLSLILLNWRRYRVVFTADIVKMFRQIRVVPEHQDYQRIIWSPDASSEPVEFRLNTVTYGTACAPYLAIRTLSQLVQDEGTRFPLGARCLQTETYVDDIFAGADDIATAIRKRVDIVELLASAGIQLDKWAANYSELLPDAVRQVAEKSIENNQTVKTLGVRWVPEQDEFRFDAASMADMAAAHTKRSVLSNIARLFDPLGWLSPVTVVAKILMQDMWLLKCDWDAPLPSEIRERWYRYCQGLVALPGLSVRRWLGSTAESSCQIHGFADASARAYAAAVYLRIDEGHGRFRVSLLASKSKVAPVKTVSIPNLELCRAALLVKLILHLTSLDFLQRCPIFAWSDSQIVLTWLRKHPCHWKTFVANRVSLIQTQLPSATWSHVQTKENPADLASRGVLPKESAESSLWWRGPAWLSMSSVQWPHSNEAVRVHHVRHSLNEPEILTRFSSLTKLLSKRLPKGNHLAKLNPFLNKDDGLLRVGGRLASSYLTFDRKHPPILPQNSYLSRLFVRHAHHQCLHGGPTLNSSYLMSQVWILSRNRLVKSAIRSCITCQRARPQLAHQLMAAIVLKEDFYVDDLLTGAHTVREAKQIRDELIHITKRAGMHLRQWASNCVEILEDLDTTDNNIVSLDSSGTVKTLGINWNAAEDNIGYTVKRVNDKTRITKRSILSEISQLFDPLGSLPPVVITVKIVMQGLW
ncbi:uncharacterized protein LOC122514393 [Polistes fuscatus]|uniref:uncharacterized protein LOC122514393 n=1 Tax=Polistes fuscatus TaxID=30207 RepID=UPI001CAA14E7|nr:uncharacterized protein LOC122514393 [Polistes fuscatus]